MTPRDQRHIGQISIDTRTIANRLELVETGEVVTYVELTKLIGKNVQGEGRSTLESARRFVLREHRRVFGVVLNEGLKRLSNDEIPDTRISAEAHVRRHAKRTIQVLLAANYDALAPQKQRELTAGITQMRLHELVASEKTAKRLEAEPERKQQQISTEESLRETLRGF